MTLYGFQLTLANRVLNHAVGLFTASAGWQALDDQFLPIPTLV